MTKRDYIAIAEVIRENTSPDGSTILKNPLIEEFCRIAKRDNSAFKPQLFKDAAGYNF